MGSERDGPLYRVLGALDQPLKKSGAGFIVKCPGHEDTHASLSIGTGLNGRVLLKCHKGCTADAIVAALGLDMTDLFEKSSAGNPIRRFRLINQQGNTVATHVREDVPGDKQMWWESHGRNGLNGTPLESLPLYRLPDVLSADPLRPVIVCEGEAAADALADLGLLAVGTVTGASGTPSEASLAALMPHPVWLWPDNDKPGREHMQRVAARLKSQVRWIDWPSAPEKGDAADYVSQGGTALDVPFLLRVERVEQSSDIRIVSMAQLQHLVLPEPRWAVPGIFPEGVVLLVGKSKLGKSWFALDVGLAVATGAKAWGHIGVEQGEVLYLALEDSERRLSDRMAQIYGERPWPASFLYAVKFPRANEGGLELVLEWVNSHPSARLIIIDVLGKFRPREANVRRLYDMDYDAIGPIAELARSRGICILILHHANKLKPEDPIDSVSGTTGLAGAADAICIFRRERQKADAALLITGRDVEEQELAFRFALNESRGYAWEMIGDAATLRLSAERQEILDVVMSQPGVTPTDLAGAVGRSTTNVRHMLFKMCRDGQIRNYDGKYFPPLYSDRGNRGNEVILNSNGVTPPAPRGNTLDPNSPVTPATADTASTSDTSATSSAQLFQTEVTRPARKATAVKDDYPVCAGCGGELPKELIAEGLHPGCTLED